MGSHFERNHYNNRVTTHLQLCCVVGQIITLVIWGVGCYIFHYPIIYGLLRAITRVLQNQAVAKMLKFQQDLLNSPTNTIEFPLNTPNF